ncbi:hypothetical protein PCC9214_01546 [Planktothrix tepida]|uniref:DUF1800 domain-containing protein n=2 Tax=Planktothrix TaxID=54304 RepID=A0A1J1LH84_9CYAN|nr:MULTISPECIES: DUF1800 domain-containing protein [Planktothrix]CAD5935063.1 hypothetical protein PCC9214_01546 [Planktothrix tepida]CAD5976352.1 hypothetical protein NO713_04199 [Planktothrix pseudagardhii]CUR31835.1 conserved hypothetical protein [Planktothrix tepida PCC 9214]
MSDPKLFHLINRVSFGITPGQLQQIQQMGIETYIKTQLQSQTISYPADLNDRLNPLNTLVWQPGEVILAEKQTVEQAKTLGLDNKSMDKIKQSFNQKIMQQAKRGRLLRAFASPRQLEEVMVEFWYNHFNVFAAKDNFTRQFFSSYEQHAIRPYALGKFRQLLGATAKHPAMLVYLDNWRNTAPGSPGAKGQFQGLNENYARELLELHTLGVNGGYTQNDIIALAKILTGWGLFQPIEKTSTKAGFYFEEARHDFTNKVFLGYSIKGSGINEGEEALNILAQHPSTAQHISYKLAQNFVSDNPPESLVKLLAKTFLDSEGNIATVLQTLFKSDEFWKPNIYQTKFKTPYRYIVSIMRVVGTVTNFEPLDGILNQLGMPLYGCPSPDGYKNIQSAWLNPDAMVRRSSLSVPLSRGLLHDGKPIDAEFLASTLENNFSPQTRSVLEKTDPNLRGALILGSPEFMMY